MIRALLTGLLVLGACREDCHRAELDCDGPCPVLADEDPRVTGRTGDAFPCRLLHACVTRAGDTFVRVREVDVESPRAWWFDEEGRLVATARTTDDGTARCGTRRQGLEITCDQTTLLFDSCAEEESDSARR